MDGPLDKVIDATGRASGLSHAGRALIGGGLRVGFGGFPVAFPRFRGLLQVVVFGSEPFDTPRLAGAYQGEDAAANQGVFQHPPTPLR